MRRITRRITAWALTLFILAGLCPIVLAEETETTEEETVTLAAAANTSFETAVPIQPNVPVTLEADQDHTAYYYELELNQQCMFAKLICEEGIAYGDLYQKADSSYLGMISRDRFSMISADGTVILCVRTDGTSVSDRITFTVSLLENDPYEFNNRMETAAPLTYGDSTGIVLGEGDVDWFSVVTDKDGQDVALEISGFNYEVQGSLHVHFDSDNLCFVSTNKTLYFHAAKAGTHYIELGSNSSVFPITVKAELLDGDAQEPNDTKDTATLLGGQDLTFSIGGLGDEDWFAFEAVSNDDGTPRQYTLQFLNLNTDYSDEFYYDLYTPDGTAIQTGTKVNIRHSNIIACAQQGLYYVRAYCSNEKVTRASLRIRVQEGGGDPYESNDTWLTAAPIQIGQPVQFILANTIDQDWFRFDVPEAGMTLAMTFDKRTSISLYSGESLQAQGDSSNYLYSRSTSDTEYYKLTEPGAYYLKLTSESSDVSTDLRTMICTLTAPEDPENNDTWKTAAPAYEGVPQRFDLSAENDLDWFRLEVPEGARHLLFHVDNTSLLSFKVYRESDFLNIGDDAPPMYRSLDHYSPGSQSIPVPVSSGGTYYVRFSNPGIDRGLNSSFSFVCVCESAHNTMETALNLEPGVWSQPSACEEYLCVGQLKAGNVLRVSQAYSGTAEPYYHLYNSDGKRVGDSAYFPRTWKITADDTYYLYHDMSTDWIDGQPATSRFRYDIGSGTEQVTAIEGPDTLSMVVGERIVPDLRLSPYNAMSQADHNMYACSVSNPDVFGYDYYGAWITAKAAGTAVLTVNANDGNMTALTKTIEITVTDPVAANSITIQDAPATLPLGQRASLTAVCDTEIASRSVTWTSSDPKVLYVSSTGAVTAVGRGTATITASNGAAASVSITVTKAETPNAVDNVRLDRYSMTLYMGEEPGRLTATVLPQGSQATVQWTSSNPSAALVQNGIITAVAPGVSVITASAGDYKASCVVTIQAARVRVTGISFAESSLQIPKGGTTTLLPTITPYNATTTAVTWVSSDESVATVSRTGIVNTLAVGKTTITVTTLDGGYQASVEIEVTVAPQLGDINGDGYVDSADALITLRCAVGSYTLTDAQRTAADVNHDGTVDAGDAIRILRYDARLIDGLT